MLQRYENTTNIIQHFIDVDGRPKKADLGETITYEDQHSRPSSIDGLALKVETDDDGNILYIGYAKPGTAVTAQGWAIKKRTVVGQVETWPWAGKGFVLRYRWDNRANLNY